MVFVVLQIIVSVLLIFCVLLQMQSNGLSSTFGRATEFYRSKRSIEKLLVRITVVLAFLFGVLSIIQFLPH